MKRCRITRALPVVGGLLGAAFLPAAFAFAAGGYSFTPDGDSEVVGFFGMNPMSPQLVLSPPAISGSFQGYGEFDVANGGTDLGDVHADVSSLSLAPGDYWDTHTYLITQSTVPSIAPGSLFEIDTFNFLGLTFTTTYSDVIDADGTHTYTLTTPFGTSDNKLDLSDYPAFQTGTTDGSILDNATYLTPAELQSYLLDTDDITGGTVPAGNFGPDYSFAPAADSPIQVEAITGALPTVFAVQGFQNFDVTDAAGATTGSFTAAVTDTADFGSNSSQAFLVTGSGDSGLPVGSVFMNFYIFDSQLVNHYSDIVGPDGKHVINDYLSTANGNTIPLPFLDIDLTKDIYDPFSFNAQGYDISSIDGTQSIVATNGLPPFDIAIQGYQNFDYTGPGDAAGTFTATQTTTSDLIGDVFHSLLVTSSTGDGAPGDGSVFVDWNLLGIKDFFGITYSDVVTDSGTNQIWDTFDILGLNISIPVLPLFAIPQDMLDFFIPS